MGFLGFANVYAMRVNLSGKFWKLSLLFFSNSGVGLKYMEKWLNYVLMVELLL